MYKHINIFSRQVNLNDLVRVLEEYPRFAASFINNFRITFNVRDVSSVLFSYAIL